MDVGILHSQKKNLTTAVKKKARKEISKFSDLSNRPFPNSSLMMPIILKRILALRYRDRLNENTKHLWVPSFLLSHWGLFNFLNFMKTRSNMTKATLGEVFA